MTTKTKNNQIKGDGRELAVIKGEHFSYIDDPGTGWHFSRNECELGNSMVPLSEVLERLDNSVNHEQENAKLKEEINLLNRQINIYADAQEKALKKQESGLRQQIKEITLNAMDCMSRDRKQIEQLQSKLDQANAKIAEFEHDWKYLNETHKKELDAFTRASKDSSVSQASPVEKQQTQWVSVEDRLPEKDGVYIFRRDKYLPNIGIGDFTRKTGTRRAYKFSFITSQNMEHIVDDITHWMPLPDPPNTAASASNPKDLLEQEQEEG